MHLWKGEKRKISAFLIWDKCVSYIKRLLLFITIFFIIIPFSFPIISIYLLNKKFMSKEEKRAITKEKYEKRNIDLNEKLVIHSVQLAEKREGELEYIKFHLTRALDVLSYDENDIFISEDDMQNKICAAKTELFKTLIEMQGWK